MTKPDQEIVGSGLGGSGDTQQAPMWLGMFGDAAVYTVANVLNRAFPFFLLPVLTRYLTPAEYGTYVMYQVILNFILPIIGINAEAAVSREFFLLGRHELGRYVANTLFVTGLVTLVLFGGALVFGGPIAHFLDFPVHWLPVIVLVALGESIKAVQLALWQMQKRAKAYATVTVLQTVLRFAASLAPLVFFSGGLEGLLWGYSSSLVAFALYSGYVLVSEGNIIGTWDRAYVRAFLRYGVPLVPHRVSGWLMGMADRVIIAKFTSLAAVGIYSVGYSLGAGVALLQDAFNRAWVPFFFDRLQRGDAKSRLKIVQFIYLYGVAMVGSALLVTLLAPFLFPLFGPRFAGARVFVVWIALSYALNGIYKMFANFLFFSERTYLLSYITISVGVVSLAISVALIALAGVIGAGYAAVISQLLACVAVFMAARRLFAMPWREGLVTLAARMRAGREQ